MSQGTELLARTTAANTAQIDALAFAAHAIWRSNGHDIPSALLHVHRNHMDPQIAALAGEAYDMILATPVLWRAFEIEFAERAAAER